MAFSFDGTNDAVSLADNAALTLPDADWTISGWFKLTTITYPADDPRILQWGTSGANTIVLAFGTAGTDIDKIYLSSQDADTTVITADPGGNFSADTNWHNIIVQRSSTTVTVYLDNSSIASVSNASYDAVNNADSFYLGNGAALARPFGGLMAEWAKWDVALDASQRASLVSGYSPSFFKTSLMWYVPMIREYIETKTGIVITNSGTIVADHPRIIYPSSGFNTKGITAAEQTVTLSGLASTSAYGTQSVLLNINTTGIASTGAFGTQSILLNINASGIASISAIGTQILANTQILTLSGIASSSAFGTQSVLLNLNLSGIPSTTALGTQSILLNLTLSGIPSTAAIGTASLGLNLGLSGISSTSAFGTGTLNYVQSISPSGIASTTLFGLAELGNVQVVLLDGLPSVSAFGTSALFDRSFTIVTTTAGDFELVED